MGIRDTIKGWVWNFLMPDAAADQEWSSRLKQYEQYKDYYEGRHKRQIKQKPDQADDNLTLNFVELVVDRSISMLLGDELQFELPTDEAQAYIDEVMEANDYDILLYDAEQNASIYGTGFLKLSPGGVESKQTENKMLTRLIALDPRWMKIVTPDEDIGKTTGYEMRFNIGDTARKEVTEISAMDENGRVASWLVSNYVINRDTGGQWQLMGEPVVWPYEFPPIIHWKNLPQANDCYGQSDVEDIIELNNRINFVAGNISRVIRYHSHPKTWGRGAGLGNRVSWGPDEIVMVQGTDAQLQNLEMQSDLGSSREFYNDLRQALFDISRTVDITSMKDRVGQLTNFGLKVLYGDALAKLSTKRKLFGGALTETVHRLLVLGKLPGDPGTIQWQDPLPVAQDERDLQDGFDLEHNLASKETISVRRGYDYPAEVEKISLEKQAEDNIGSALLRAFEGGR